VAGFSLSPKDIDLARADVVALFCPAGSKQPRGLSAGSMRRSLARAMKVEEFSGKEGEVLVWHAPEGAGAARYVLVGTGKPAEFDENTTRRVFALLARRFQGNARHLAATLPTDKAAVAAAHVQAAVEGFALGGHRWSAWKTVKPADKKKQRPVRLTLLTDRTQATRTAMERGQVTSRATILARELISETPSTMTPREMEKRARRVAREAGLKIAVYDEKRAERLGMGCFLGVARGSEEPPRMLHLVYSPRRKPRGKVKRVALVGKGITFDSGGLSLKPAGSMETMKSDMSGSAVVLATLSALKELDCAVEVHGILMMSENMPSGRAYKPGDILRSMSGKTVEILNTDAEGRLVLADGLEFAKKQKPDRIIDLATLTGACVVALGTLCTGVMGYDRKFVDDILDAGAAAGEKVWPLPFFSEYRKLLDSKVADIKHIGNRWGGAITAGMFLGEFAGKTIPWVHMDIAGPAYTEEDQPLARTGGTGHPVRTLLSYLIKQR
jgi:leucyl aminopeptidase